MKHTVLLYSYNHWRENFLLFNFIQTATPFLQKCPVIPFFLLLWLCLLFPPAAGVQLCRVVYAPCHVLSLPKSYSQLRSQLRSAGVDGASAQRAHVHYFYFLTEAANPFCSDMHVLSLISPTRYQTAQRRSRRDENAQKEEAEELLTPFFPEQRVFRTILHMLNAQMSNKSTSLDIWAHCRVRI